MHTDDAMQKTYNIEFSFKYPETPVGIKTQYKAGIYPNQHVPLLQSQTQRMVYVLTSYPIHVGPIRAKVWWLPLTNKDFRGDLGIVQRWSTDVKILDCALNPSDLPSPPAGQRDKDQ